MRRSWRATGLTVPQAAKVCGVSDGTVRQWICRGRLARNEWRLIDPAALLAFVDTWGNHDMRRTATQRGLTRRTCAPVG